MKLIKAMVWANIIGIGWMKIGKLNFQSVKTMSCGLLKLTLSAKMFDLLGAKSPKFTNRKV